jgi:hypothetical protein
VRIASGRLLTHADPPRHAVAKGGEGSGGLVWSTPERFGQGDSPRVGGNRGGGTVVRVICRGQEGNRGGGVRARDSRHALAAEAGAVYTVPLIVYKNIYIKIIRTY